MLTGTFPCVFNSALRGEHCTPVGLTPVAPWDLTLSLTLPLTRTLHRNLSRLRSLTLHFTRTITWVLTSALKGDHETAVASALATSVTALTLSKSLSPWGPNQNRTTPCACGSESLRGHSAWNLGAPMSFHGPAAAETIPEPSPTRGPGSCVAFEAKH